MNAEDIDNMQAGRELDMLVAEKVMGWIWSVEVWTYTTPPYKYGQRLRCLRDLERCAYAEKWNGKEELPIKAQPEEYQCPEYSTDIAAAWQVVEKMRQSGLSQQFLTAFECLTPWRWALLSTQAFCLNVCRAALKAIAATIKAKPQVDGDCWIDKDDIVVHANGCIGDKCQLGPGSVVF